MLTLKLCLLLNFIYLQYKKNKNILLINQRKDEKQKIKISEENHNTHL